MKSNWNDNWYPYMKVIARKLTGGKFKNIDADELINFAWIDTVRRLDSDVPMYLVGKVAAQSMLRYLYGRKGRKHVPVHMTTVYDERGETELKDKLAREPSLSYDDIDELAKYLEGLTDNQRYVVLLLLQGWNQQQVAGILGVSTPAISARMSYAKAHGKAFRRKHAC